MDDQREPQAAPELAMIIGEYMPAQMSTSNNRILPNKVCIGWHFSSNKYAYRDTYLALKSNLALSTLKYNVMHSGS